MGIFLKANAIFQEKVKKEDAARDKAHKRAVKILKEKCIIFLKKLLGDEFDETVLNVYGCSATYTIKDEFHSMELYISTFPKFTCALNTFDGERPYFSYPEFNTIKNLTDLGRVYAKCIDEQQRKIAMK